MSHVEQIEFFRTVADRNLAGIARSRVLEVGSYDVNGSVRGIFPAAEYVGVDLAEGPGVDLVSYGHELDLPDGSFDLAISGECFEHDPHWRETFTNMVRLTRPGGLVVFTCAGPGRMEHGTRRSDATLSPGTQSVGLDYYRNLSDDDFRELPLDRDFSEFRFWRQKHHCDLYFSGVRRGEAAPDSVRYELPLASAVDDVLRITPAPRVRVASVPIRLAHRILSEDHYQRFALRYWSTLLRANRGVKQTLAERH